MIVLSRQKLSSAVVSGTSMEGVQQGGYTVSDNTEPGKVPDLIILATGAELELSEKAATKLREESNFAVGVGIQGRESINGAVRLTKISFSIAACLADTRRCLKWIAHFESSGEEEFFDYVPFPNCYLSGRH